MLVLMLGYMFVHVENFVGEIAFEENIAVITVCLCIPVPGT